MSGLSSTVARLRSVDLERIRGLRPNYPPVAVEVNRREMVLVRLKRRRGALTLEAHQARPLPEASVGASIFRPNLGSPAAISERIQELFGATGTKPGRISVVLPDNLAKVSLVTLPALPGSRRQLTEVIRFKLRRSVPFKLDDAVLSYQVLSSEPREVRILVGLMLRSVVEQYERVFRSVGARPGLVDLCTPNLFNLCRAEMDKVGGDGDVALINCTDTYFSFLILRGGQLVFFRCKSYAVGDQESHAANGVMTRELNSSLSYYEEKLEGEGIETLFVRSGDRPIDELTEYLGRFPFGRVVTVDPSASLGLPEGARLEPAVAQRIAPAIGAAAGRGR